MTERQWGSFRKRIRILAFIMMLIIVQSIESYNLDMEADERVYHWHKKLVLCFGPPHHINCHCFPSGAKVFERLECSLQEETLVPHDEEWDLFKTQPLVHDLVIIDESDDKINYFPVEAIAHLKKMKSFQLENAKIHKIPYRAFSNLSELQTIHLRRNQIHTLSKYAFTNHRSLKEISLENNRIQEIHRDVFVELPRIVRLNFSSNNIRMIHDGAFDELGNLHTLLLDNNKLTVPTREMFLGLSKLNFLTMSHNQIDYVGDAVFAELGSLQHLIISENSMTGLSERGFDGLDNLGILNLKQNNLRILERDIFTGTPALVSLNLGHNRLETLTYGNILPLMENLINDSFHLMIEGNHFHCDCRMNWIYYLRNRTIFEPLKEKLDKIKCVWPSEMGGMELLETDLNAEDNGNITVINMIHLNYRKLPCPVDFNDPSELPLSPYRDFGMALRSNSPSILNTKMNSCNSILIILTVSLLALV